MAGRAGGGAVRRARGGPRPLARRTRAGGSLRGAVRRLGGHACRAAAAFRAASRAQRRVHRGRVRAGASDLAREPRASAGVCGGARAGAGDFLAQRRGPAPPGPVVRGPFASCTTCASWQTPRTARRVGTVLSCCTTCTGCASCDSPPPDRCRTRGVRRSVLLALGLVEDVRLWRRRDVALRRRRSRTATVGRRLLGG